MVDGSCGDQKSLDMYIAILNLLQDVMVVVLPMPILWRLQMAMTKKVALSGIFGIGIMYGFQFDQLLVLLSKQDADVFLCCSICAITIYRVQVTSTIGDPTDLHAQDTYCLIALLTSLEALLGIVSACLPMLKPLVRKLWGSLSERGTKTTKSCTLGCIPIVMRGGQMENPPSGKHSSGGFSLTTDPFWYEREVEGKRQIQGSTRLRSDCVIETGITGKPHSRDATPKAWSEVCRSSTFS